MSINGKPLEVWGTQGHGGYGGSGGAIVWVVGQHWYQPVHCVFAGVSNTFLDLSNPDLTHEMKVYEMAQDFAANFLWG